MSETFLACLHATRVCAICDSADPEAGRRAHQNGGFVCHRTADGTAAYTHHWVQIDEHLFA